MLGENSWRILKKETWPSYGINFCVIVSSKQKNLQGYGSEVGLFDLCIPQH